MKSRRPDVSRMQSGQDLIETAATLPDLVRCGLDVLFVGINPSLYSVAKGHYFARPTNRFWPAFSQSRLSREARRGLATDNLRPEHDHLLPDYGFGFTDAVKRATARAGDLKLGEFVEGMIHLIDKIEKLSPNIVCFHGVMAYRQVHAHVAAGEAPLSLGLQTAGIAASRIFLVPNPSPANAHFTMADQCAWYDELADCLATGQHRRPR